jgi:hypothetical protein
MGFPTKVQLIKRKSSEQWYINFPSALAQAMEFNRGEVAEWFVEDKETLVLHRSSAPERKLKKKPQSHCLKRSSDSLKNAKVAAGRKRTGKDQRG